MKTAFVLFLLQKLHVIHSFLLITIEYSANPVVSLIGFSKDLSHHCISKQIIALEILSFTIMLLREYNGNNPY